MKYVRVYESDYEQEYITTYQDHCEHVADLQDAGFDFEGYIIKQADSIEELCDLIVVDNNSEYFTYYLPGEKGLKTFCQLRDNGVLTENDSVRCYIWIDDKGVKVAEMNDKGELELL